MFPSYYGFFSKTGFICRFVEDPTLIPTQYGVLEIHSEAITKQKEIRKNREVNIYSAGNSPILAISSFITVSRIPSTNFILPTTR